MDKGIIWDISKGYPAHVLSWHEMNIPKLGNIRVWIHSKGESTKSDFSYGKDNRARVTFTFGSIEIQIQGETFSQVTENEKQLRLELARCAPANTNRSVKSSNFRFIPVGQLEVDHMQCIKACYDKNKFIAPSGIRLVKSEKTPTLIFKGGIILKGGSSSDSAKNLAEFRSTKNFAIAIAKMYSDLSQIGTQKIIKQISIDTGLSSENIYTSLRVARGQGWLTSNGVGKAGGTLSSLGLEAFIQFDGEKTLKNLLNQTREVN
jgi:hypothetical protein